MADEKEVTVKILAEVDDNDVSDLEDRLEELNNNEVEVDVTSDSSEVDNCSRATVLTYRHIMNLTVIFTIYFEFVYSLR